LENFQNQDGGQAFFCEALVANFWAFFKKIRNFLKIFS
jgi:hypothetical protein